MHEHENTKNIPAIGKTMRIRRGKHRNFEGEVVGLHGNTVRLTDGISWVCTTPSNLIFISEKAPVNPELGAFVKIRFTNHRFQGRTGVIKHFSPFQASQDPKTWVFLIAFSDGKHPHEGWVHVNDIDISTEVKVIGMLRG
jgi:hypothetical protein